MPADYFGYDPKFEEVSTRFQQLTGMDFLDYLADSSWDTQYSQPGYLRLPVGPGGDPNEVGKYGAVVEAWRQSNQAGIQRLRTSRGTSTFWGAGGPIDVEAIFGPLKGQIDELTRQSTQAGRASITRGAQQAEEFASESLAGTGMGRSGIGAGTFQRIGQGVAEKIEASDAAVRQRGDEAKMKVDEQAATLQFAEGLRERGYNEEDIRSAINFRRQMALAELQSSLEIAANEPTFWEEWSPLFEIVGNIGAAYIGGGA